MARFHSYQQLEHSDCGITCIRMIARFYGKSISNEAIRNACDMSRLGISIADIVDAFKTLGMESIPVRLTPSEAKNMPLPAVLYWEQKHFVVLYKITSKHFYIADPSCGKLKFTHDEFFQRWLCGNDRGLAVLVDSTDDFQKRNFDKPVTKWRLFSTFKASLVKNKRAFLSVIIFSIIALGGDVLLPLIFQHTIDDGISGRNINLVWLLILGQFLVSLGNYVSNSVVEYVLTKLGLKMGISMLHEYLSKLIGLPMIFYARKVNSDLIQKAEDQSRIKDFLVGMPNTLFFTAVTLIVFSGMLIYYSWQIFLLFLTLTALGFGWTSIFLRRRREIDYGYTAAVAENRNNLYELIHGMPEIKTNNAQQTKIEHWNSIQEKVNGLSIKSALLRLTMNGGNNLITRIKDIAITGICATLVIKGSMTIGVMMTISYIIGRLSTPFSNLLASISSIQDACMSYERVEEVLNAPLLAYENLKTEFTCADICVNNLSFKYPGSGSPYVLKDINLTIPAGKMTALVGISGCGKTTLIKLLLNMFDPQLGNITIGGMPLQSIKEDAWLSKIGVVLQNGTIFSGSILENIALGDKTPNVEKAIEAARLACLDKFIASLPMKHNTRIGVAGIEISGGQKQRLLIARAIYKNPEILILDEATSSLDAENEANIVRNLAQYFTGKTIIVAAHRLSTVSRADNIVFMDAGNIHEQGTHEELVSAHGKYYSLVKNQLELGA